MRSLAEPTIDDIALYDAIAAAKRPPRRTRLNAVRDVVLQAYDDYQAARPHLGTLVAPNLSDDAREALHHCFAGETAPLIEVRSALTAPLRAVRCPFCGISEASTLDHYLPKELYPVYSVYSRNLVPCCPQCNARKSEKVVDQQTGVRRFLHPYYDTVPADAFLRVSIRLEPNLFVIAFRVARPQGLSVGSTVN